MSSNVIIFDTTLRDGEQSPGVSISSEEKLRIALSLEALKVDIIEAGFAIASPGDFKAIHKIAQTIKNSTICSLSRALQKDIDAAYQAIKPAKKKRIHTFIATSNIHMKHKLCMTPNDVIGQAIFAVKHARNLVDDVEFSCEDAGRSDFDFLCRIIESAINAGASTINIPDTVGYALPHQFGHLIHKLINNIPNADKAIFSVHCHNDLGLAVANSLSAVVNGARQVECTINGLGERAGNASLEEITMAIKTRADELKVTTGIHTPNILNTSKLVSSLTGFTVQPNKAIVGANAFAHESGIHQDGILKHRETYEIMKAEDVGWHANRLTLGKLSGRNAFKTKMSELGMDFNSQEALDSAFTRFKTLADQKTHIFDEDLQALITNIQSHVTQNKYQLIELETSRTMDSLPEATLSIRIDTTIYKGQSSGDGMIDAIFKSIESAVHSNAKLELYQVNSITQGSDSQGSVIVRLKKDQRIVNGSDTNTDVVIASAYAYINALNLLENTQPTAKIQVL